MAGRSKQQGERWGGRARKKEHSAEGVNRGGEGERRREREGEEERGRDRGVRDKYGDRETFSYEMNNNTGRE